MTFDVKRHNTVLIPTATVTLLSSVSIVQAATIKFQASLNGTQVVPATLSTATGKATLELNEDATQLSYFISLEGLNLVEEPLERTNPEDVTAIHFHIGLLGNNGPHVLNIFGMPSEDDSDLVVDFTNNTLAGIWDDGDVIASQPFAPGDTKPLTAFVDDLVAGKLYIQVHPTDDDRTIRGQISSIPEPSISFGLFSFIALNFVSKISKKRIK